MLGRNLCKSSLTNTVFLYRGGHFVFGCWKKSLCPRPRSSPQFPGEANRPIPLKGSLRGRRLKGKGKGVLGARETRGAREEGGGGKRLPGNH